MRTTSRGPDLACRLAWRPSRWEAAAVRLLGVLGAGSALGSDLATPWSEGLAGVAVLVSVLEAHRGRRRRVRRLVVSGDATLDGVQVDVCRLQWRGPLAFLQARDASGRTHRLAWWPDTLGRAQRRALRRAFDALQRPSRVTAR